MRNATALIAATLVGSTFAGAGAFAESPKSPGEQASLDSQITQTVKAELSTDRVTQGQYIRVTTQNGVVGLYGGVGTAAERQRAEQDARSVHGVTDVRNELAVKR